MAQRSDEMVQAFQKIDRSVPPPPRPSRLDRVIEYIAPQLALRRDRARRAMDLVRHYEAAAVGRRTGGWNRARGDANAVVGPAIANVRATARDLARNNAFARRAIKTIANHAVGWGIKPKPSPANKQALDVWSEWAETTACDADGRNDFYGLQKLVTRTVAESGEALIRRRWRRPEDDLPIPMQIQVLEGDYLDTDRTNDVMSANGQLVGRIINGVEFDIIGRRVAYWLFQEHPGALLFGGGYNSVRVPAEGVAHVYYQERPGQVRGMSWLASIILLLKDFDEYVDAQLLKQKVAAYLSVVMTDATGASPRIGVADDQDTAGQPNVDYIKPGAVLYGPPGYSAEVVQPPRVAEFRDYASVTLHNAAAGMDVPYEDMVGDFSEINYSSARMSRLSHWDSVHDWRWQMLIPQMCDPCWGWAMQAAALVSRVREAPRALWTPPPMPMIEPDKEGIAIQRNIRTGITSLSEELRARGYDPKELLAEIAADFKMLDSMGIVLDCDPRKMTAAGQLQGSAAAAAAPAPQKPDAPTDETAPPKPVQATDEGDEA